MKNGMGIIRVTRNRLFWIQEVQGVEVAVLNEELAPK